MMLIPKAAIHAKKIGKGISADGIENGTYSDYWNFIL